ncbi:MAG: ABC transporter permease [Lachnospiraceae bacterium]|nr:ABC transporter permease [Lachnospiraceae bacterium]
MVSYLVMKNNWKRAWNHKALLLLTFIVPIVLCLITGIVNEASKNPSLRIGVANLESLTEREQQTVYQVLEETKRVQYEETEKKYQAKLYRGIYDLVLDYKDSDQADQFVIHTIKKQEIEVQMKDALARGMHSGKNVDFSMIYQNRPSAKAQMTSFLTTMLMIFSVIRLSVLIKDRQERVMERFLYAPAQKWMYVTGIMEYQIVFTFLQSGLIFFILSLCLKDSAYTLKEGFILSFVVTAAATAFGTLICMISKSEVSANVTASGAAIILSLLGGTFVPIDSMPKLLQAVSIINPMRLIMELMQIVS